MSARARTACLLALAASALTARAGLLAVTSSNDLAGHYWYTVQAGSAPFLLGGVSNSLSLVMPARGVLSVISPPGWIADISHADAVVWVYTGNAALLMDATPRTFGLHSSHTEPATYDAPDDTTPLRQAAMVGDIYTTGRVLYTGLASSAIASVNALCFERFSFVGPSPHAPSDVADFVIALATGDYATVTLGWSNGTIKVLACTNQCYTSDLSSWFELASDVTSPWTHQDASNYPVIFYRIVSGVYTSQYDVGKYTVTLTPGSGGNPAYNWLSPPLELFSNTVNYVLGNQLNYDASSFDVLQAQIPIGGAQIDNYYVDGLWTDGNDEPLTRFATGQGYILVVDATHETPKTVAFVGKVPAVAVTNMLIEPSGGNPAYNWIGAPTPALRGFFVNGLTNAVVTTEAEQNFDVYQNQVTLGGAQKDWYYVGGQWDDGEFGTPQVQTPGMGGILVLDQNHTGAATTLVAPKTR